MYFDDCGCVIGCGGCIVKVFCIFVSVFVDGCCVCVDVVDD